MKMLMLNGIPDNDRYKHFEKDFETNLHLNTKDQIDYFRLRDMNIQYCCGCWSCWVKTPGYCAISDDHEQILSRFNHADRVVFITPIIAGYESALIKTCKDRIIPIVQPYTQIYHGEMHHVQRYPKSPDIELVLLTDETTTEDDIHLIQHTYDRVALNFNSTVVKVTTYQPQGGDDRVLSRH